MSRLNRDEVNLNVALIVAQRGTCLRAKVGAVATLDNRIISTGYNGAPKGMPHCTSTSCTPDAPCLNSIHAEANLIYYAARKGVALEGAILYVTHSPCRKCSEAIIQSGIKEVVYLNKYRATDWNLLKVSGVKIREVKVDTLTKQETLRLI